MIMHRNSIVRPVKRAILAASVLACATFCSAAEEDSRWVHPLCRLLAIDSNGTFPGFYFAGVAAVSAVPF